MEFQVDHFSFQSFKHVTTLSSCLNYCGREFAITHKFVPLYMFLFSGCFKDFSFPWLIWLWYSLGVYSFLHIFVLGFHWVGSVDTGFVVLFKVEIFLAIVFVKCLFCIFSPLFLKLQLHISYIISYMSASHSCFTAHWCLFIFFPLFSFCTYISVH